MASAFNKSNKFSTVLITAIIAAAHVLIQVLCKDLGSALILFVIYIFMLFAATRRLRYLVIGTGLFLAAGFAAIKLFSHVAVRVSVWLNPWADVDDQGYQIAQSLFGIGTGGWFGTGLFNGSPENIPLVNKDMVYSAVSEEFGTVFGIFLIILCLCLFIFIIKISIRLEMTFYKLLSLGLGLSYITQVFLTIGGAVKFIPLTGVTLPFISSGGSSLLASFIMFGIIESLYVISESDVCNERIKIMNGEINDIYGPANLSAYSGEESESDYEEDEYTDFGENSKEDAWADSEYDECEADYDVDALENYADNDLKDEYKTERKQSRKVNKIRNEDVLGEIVITKDGRVFRK